ncbi:conserved hypothetical protein [Streptomyces zhaozhouensis]|uniref:Repeat protein (TIGR03843 family) n=1 Tax=Streptomyces zhaozhouensis TaxID=1300267 RepID=A0A286DSA1_9ACTN|nr:SCO1664 family protein [Streptomyces zhaozhouensis]SOD61528.1 conserved hypothetical protein [Streptomyces zhaozhouensis]
MPAPERIPAQPDVTARELLAEGELTVLGRITDASNAVLYSTVERDGRTLHCVYKPVSGERPLWDFPDGTLAEREVAAHEVCRALGWDLVPPTVLREGPFGTGMVQLWVGPLPDAPDFGRGPDERLLALVEGEEAGPGWRAVGLAEVAEGRTALLVHADHPGLRRLATLDAVINNADRKGGHLLPLPDGRLQAIDHGVSFHTENKLRTLLWGWAGEPLPAEILAALEGLRVALADGGELAGRLAGLLTAAECAALRERVDALLESGRHPAPGGEWPAIPWPLV